SDSPGREKGQRGGSRIVGRHLLVDDELEIGNRWQHERIPSPVRHTAEDDERDSLLGRDARHGCRLHVLDGGAAARTRGERLEELEEEVWVREGARISTDARRQRRTTGLAPEKIAARGNARNRSTPVGIGAVPLIAAAYPEGGISFDAYRRAELRTQPRARLVLRVQIRIERHVSGEPRGDRMQAPVDAVRR